ncbi:hypothetical protein EKK58_02475 [Candidatus Dependentiae bacterium]|nr:MAG: hypothetical protein EKK58_02475 [Candidatus Dependentiae bacterium]
MNKTNTENTQLTVSYEILLLLNWIMTHEKDRFKKIIDKSLKTGLLVELEKTNNTNFTNDALINKLQGNVADFFNLLELLLHDAVSESLEKTASQKQLMDTIDHIDGAMCDAETIRTSMHTISSTLQNTKTINAKELLLKEVLKKWKPKNNIVN